MSAIAQDLQNVRESLAHAAIAAGRPPADVHLIAVSKRMPAAAIREAYAAGQRDFGENYAQELHAKQAELADLPDLRWHFIGRVQSNKAALLTGCYRVHALESARHAQAILSRAPGGLDALLYVDLSHEASKGGVAASDVLSCVRELSCLQGLRLRGLMALPPYFENPADTAPSFAELADLLARCQADGHAMTELSMGMSHDATVAVAQGATWVRVGTAIFGARPS